MMKKKQGLIIKKQKKKASCENCEGFFVYVKRDGSVVCRSCGFIKKGELKEIDG